MTHKKYLTISFCLWFSSTIFAQSIVQVNENLSAFADCIYTGIYNTPFSRKSQPQKFSDTFKSIETLRDLRLDALKSIQSGNNSFSQKRFEAALGQYFDTAPSIWPLSPSNPRSQKSPTPLNPRTPWWDTNSQPSTPSFLDLDPCIPNRRWYQRPSNSFTQRQIQPNSSLLALIDNSSVSLDDFEGKVSQIFKELNLSQLPKITPSYGGYVNLTFQGGLSVEQTQIVLSRLQQNNLVIDQGITFQPRGDLVFPSAGIGVRSDQTNITESEKSFKIVSGAKALYSENPYQIIDYREGINEVTELVNRVLDGDQGAGVLVVVIDSGISSRALDHLETISQNNNVPYSFKSVYLGQYSLLNGTRVDIKTIAPNKNSTDAFTGLRGSIADYPGHGTPIAWLVHSIAPSANILSLQACNKEGLCLYNDVFDAIALAKDFADLRGFKDKESGRYRMVINFSLGGSCPQTKQESLIRDLAGKGVLFAAAFGDVDTAIRRLCPNSPTPLTTYPAEYANSIEGLVAVGSVGVQVNPPSREQPRLPISRIGVTQTEGSQIVQAWALGKQVLSFGSRPRKEISAQNKERESYLYWFNGTSFATAQVTGLLALARSNLGGLPNYSSKMVEACVVFQMGDWSKFRYDTCR
jgi:hypothetical protein